MILGNGGGDYCMRKRRVISKSKTYGFNPYTDQIDTINQIMRETGEKTESVLLRKLVDEALAARREKTNHCHSSQNQMMNSAIDWKRSKAYSYNSFGREIPPIVSRMCFWRCYRMYLPRLMRAADSHGTLWSYLNYTGKALMRTN
jgi:hypothetical protein